MTIHVNIGEAKARLSALVSAAKRGEEVFLDKAGVPQARIVALEAVIKEDRARIIAKRRAAIGMWKEAFVGWDSIVPPSMTEEEIDARERRICAPAP
jgi:antitoxin (DNA-binding transcriptional repressor) of toxin-antitoxin stability system